MAITVPTTIPTEFIIGADVQLGYNIVSEGRVCSTVVGINDVAGQWASDITVSEEGVKRVLRIRGGQTVTIIARGI